MRLLNASLAVTLAFSASVAVHAQMQEAPSVVVKDGGVFVKGWTGVVDASEQKAGQVLNNAKLTEEGGVLHVRTGPAVTYWNPANKATGSYTVKGTFTESDYMGLNDHPHPYGIVIAGNDLGTDHQTALYCAAYGNGTFIVRGFGPEPFRMGDRKPEANPAVHKAAAKGSSVTQEIAMSVTPDKVSCSINGTVVASYDKSQVVAPGKLKSTDGVYGIRFAHNTEATVTGFGMTKP